MPKSRYRSTKPDFAIRRPTRDEIENPLFPAQPNGNAWRMAHRENLRSRASVDEIFFGPPGNRQAERLPDKLASHGN